MKKMLFALLCSGSLVAQVSLDELMPMDIQKKTGVSNLKPAQKQVLADWLATQIPGGVVSAPSYSSREVYLSENVQGGKFLRLSDDSLWEVDPIDMSRAEVWLFPFPVKVQKNGRTDYPYTLVNMNTGSKVDARKVN